MEEEKIPAELKLKLLQAEQEVNSKMPKKFDWNKGIPTAGIAAVAFFTVGLLLRAPIFSALGFALIGAIVGLLVGAVQKPGKNGK